MSDLIGMLHRQTAALGKLDAIDNLKPLFDRFLELHDDAESIGNIDAQRAYLVCAELLHHAMKTMVDEATLASK